MTRSSRRKGRGDKRSLTGAKRHTTGNSAEGRSTGQKAAERDRELRSANLGPWKYREES